MPPEGLGDRIADASARIAVVGQGYVGLPLAVAFATAGFAVTGVDTDRERVQQLNDGTSHTPDVADADVARLLGAKRYRATQELDVLYESDIALICVPTPLRKSKDPDISFVVAAAEAIAARFHPPQLVVLESTTYPGTTEELLWPMFEARGATVGQTVFLAFSPERIDPGNRRFRFRDIPKVVGGVTPACGRMAARLYAHVADRVIEVSSARVAEVAKLHENVFRNVNIALANELSFICRHLGVDTAEVIAAAASKPFGFLPFQPGPGIGGHCIGIDPFYLAWKTRLSGYEARFIQLADEINRAMPRHVISLIGQALNSRCRSVNGSRILALGVAYKAGVADVRESPALEVLSGLLAAGADVAYTDPYVPSVAIAGTVLKAVRLTDEAVGAADCVVILTDHPGIDYARVVDHASLVVDCRDATPRLPGADRRVVRL